MDIDSETNCSTGSNHITEKKSGSSDCQGEFGEYQSLASPLNYSLVSSTWSSSTQNDSGCEIQYDECINDVSHQLQSTLKSNQKYGNDPFVLEKDIELKFHNKIDNLLKSNYQLKSDLSKANEQIVRLLQHFAQVSKSSTLTQHSVQVEQKNHDLSLQNSLLQSKLLQMKIKKDEAEVQIKNSRIEINQNEIDNVMKNAVLRELKDTISNQHTEIIRISKHLSNSSDSFNRMDTEFQQTKKALEWYKQELYSLQDYKEALLDELANCKRESSVQKETISNLNIELKIVKNSLESLQWKALRDKVESVTKLQKLDPHLPCESGEHEIICVDNENNPIFREYEINIQDLQNEITRINSFVEAQNTTIKKITKDNSDLLADCAKFQKLMGQKEYSLDHLENENKRLKLEIEHSINREKQITDDYNKTKKELIDLRTELLKSKQENEIVKSTVEIIRNQVSAFKLKHDALKNELSNKEKQISFLQSEKQELFMKNNWQICELEKIKDRDELIKSLKKEIESKEQEIHRFSCQVKDLEIALKKQSGSVSKLIDEKQTVISQNEKEVERYEIVLHQYRDLLSSSEKKVNDFIKQHDDNISANHNHDLKPVYSNILLRNSCENLDDSKTSIKIESPTVSVNEESTNESHKVDNVGQKLNAKLHHITYKAKKLCDNIGGCQKILNEIIPSIQSKSSADGGEVDVLKILLQVKNLEMQERQKKHEKNNRTLLRKLKEYIKAQNSTEKRIERLQKDYECLADENRSLKLSIENNEKLKQLTVELEETPKTCSICENTNLDHPEKVDVLLNTDEADKEKLDQPMNTELLLNSEESCRSEMSNNSIEKLQEVPKENENTEEKKFIDLVVDTSTSDVSEYSEENSLNSMDDLVKKELRNKIDLLSNDNQILSSSLQKKIEEIECLELSNKQMNSSIEELKCLIKGLEDEMRDIESELDSTNKEKFFLQRLCKDLKYSFKSQANYIKVLEGKLKQISQRTEHFNSMPKIFPDIPCLKKNDDLHNIDHLLHCKTPLPEIDFTEIHDSLDGLRKEIFILQEQVKKKL